MMFINNGDGRYTYSIAYKLGPDGHTLCANLSMNNGFQRNSLSTNCWSQ